MHRIFAGERLEYEDYRGISGDIVDNRYAKTEPAAFLVSCALTGIDQEQVLSLTRAMAAENSGDSLLN